MVFFKRLLFLLVLSFSLQAEEESFIIPCRHGREMMDLMMSRLAQAEQSVELSLCIAGGSILHKVLKILEERMEVAPHLKVHLMSATTLLIDEDLEAIERLGERFKGRFFYAYTMPVPYFFPDIATVDNHVKCVIVDEECYSVGGSNFDDALISVGTFTPTGSDPSKRLLREKLPLGNRDQDVVGRDKQVAQELRRYFFQQFALWHHYNENPENFIEDPQHFSENRFYFPVKAQATVFIKPIDTSPKKCFGAKIRVVTSGPMDRENPISKAYAELIGGATSEITIGNLYFNPVQEIMESLKQAVDRGVETTVITNGLYDDSPFFCPFLAWRNRVNYLPLFYGKEYQLWEYRRALEESFFPNVHVFEYHVKEIMYHKKTMVVDKRYTVIGSYNLGARSNCCDYEIALIIDSKDVANECLDIYEEDRKYSERINPFQAVGWYFNPWTSYLGALQKQIHKFL